MSRIQTDKREVLPFAGFLGHRYAVVVDGSPKRHCYLETSDLDNACRAASDDVQNPEIYEQVSRGKWKHLRDPMAALAKVQS